MNRPLLLPCAICLLGGLLLGCVLPMPWDKGAPSPAGTDAVLYAASQPEDASAAGNQTNTVSNLSLLNASYYVLHALKHQDYEALAQVIHPQRGVTCTPLSTVSPGSDRVLTPEQIRGLAGDPSVYTWGTSDERGAPVSMTMAQYFAQYVYDTDYTQAPLIGLDQVVISGNALENLNGSTLSAALWTLPFLARSRPTRGWTGTPSS